MAYYYYQADGTKITTDTQKLLKNCQKTNGGTMTQCDITLKEYSDSEIATLGVTQKNQNSAGFIFPPNSYGFRGARISIRMPCAFSCRGGGCRGGGCRGGGCGGCGR